MDPRRLARYGVVAIAVTVTVFVYAVSFIGLGLGAVVVYPEFGPGGKNAGELAKEMFAAFAVLAGLSAAVMSVLGDKKHAHERRALLRATAFMSAGALFALVVGASKFAGDALVDRAKRAGPSATDVVAVYIAERHLGQLNGATFMSMVIAVAFGLAFFVGGVAGAVLPVRLAFRWLRCAAFRLARRLLPPGTHRDDGRQQPPAGADARGDVIPEVGVSLADGEKGSDGVHGGPPR
jgi:hypothetical protein